MSYFAQFTQFTHKNCCHLLGKFANGFAEEFEDGKSEELIGLEQFKIMWLRVKKHFGVME